MLTNQNTRTSEAEHTSSFEWEEDTLVNGPIDAIEILQSGVWVTCIVDFGWEGPD